MQSQDQPREIMHDFGNSMSIGLVIMFCISGTAQLYSRSKVGRLFFGWMCLAGIFIEGVYTALKIGIFIHADSISFLTIAGIHLIAFSLHGLDRLWSKTKGIELASYDPGYGCLAYLYPAAPNWITGLVSDATVTALFGIFFHFIRCPVQRDWFLWIVLPSLIFSQAWIRYRDQFLRQKHIDAAAEARHYAGTIGRR